jgi:NADPH:quinone reductase-like Zn-dependent oxidoreductase
VGEHVADLRVDDEVMAVGAGAFATYLTTHEALVLPKPASISHEQAATLPLAYLTASYSLRVLAGMHQGDRVLIHSAASGVGIAAVHLAHLVGAEVFRTAGSPRKRDFVRSLGVEHVFDSRSLDFAERIREITGGRGVDIALNSFSDEFIVKTFSVLAEGGRFIEIGKRGVWTKEEAARHRPDVTYEIIDLAQMMAEAPETLQPVFRGLGEEFGASVLPSLPVRGFPVEETVDAFRYAASSAHRQAGGHPARVGRGAPGGFPRRLHSRHLADHRWLWRAWPKPSPVVGRPRGPQPGPHRMALAYRGGRRDHRRPGGARCASHVRRL